MRQALADQIARSQSALGVQCGHIRTNVGLEADTIPPSGSEQ
jgi:hypothetical protein